MDRVFEIPVSMEIAISRLGTLIAEANLIKLHLEDTNRKTDGERMKHSDYIRWREKAVYALSVKDAEIRFLNTWLNVEKCEKITVAASALVWIVKHIGADHSDGIPPSDVETARKITQDLEALLI
jgi:gamma-glutamyl phosphate reductase